MKKIEVFNKGVRMVPMSFVTILMDILDDKLAFTNYRLRVVPSGRPIAGGPSEWSWLFAHGCLEHCELNGQDRVVVSARGWQVIQDERKRNGHLAD